MVKALSSKTIVWIDLAADIVVAAVKIAASLFTGSGSIAASGV
jgi:divalent metal cation (Fe/Co/Zn/Cd) transporter